MAAQPFTSIPAVFHNIAATPLYALAWTPASPAAYAATCLFLVVLAASSRALLAARALLEPRWFSGPAAPAGPRDLEAGWYRRGSRFVRPARAPMDRKFSMGLFVMGSPTPGHADAQAPAGAGAGTVKEGVKGATPFRWGTDVPRAFYVMVTAGVGYLLMFAVTTRNVGYFMAVLVGTFLGEISFGRYAMKSE